MPYSILVLTQMQSRFLYIDREELKEPLYENYRRQTPTLHPVQEMWFLDIMTDRNWGFIHDPKRNIAFAVPYNKKIPGVHQGFMPQLIQQIRPLGAGDYNAEILEELLACIAECLKKSRVRFSPVPKMADTVIKHYNGKYRTNNIIVLNQNREYTRAIYSKRFRSYLRKADNSLDYTGDISVKEFMQFYRAESAPDRPTSEESFNRIETVVRESISRNQGFLRTVKTKQGKILSCGYFLQSEYVIMYSVLVSSAEARDKYAAHWLTDQVLHENHEFSGVFDFCGSDMPGVALWMSHFKPSPVQYLEFDIDTLNPVISTAFSTMKKIQSVFRK